MKVHLPSYRQLQAMFCGLALLCLYACKSGEKLYNKGRYDEAVLTFVKKLQKRPNDTKALQLLPAAYDHSLQQHEEKVSQLLRSNNELKWESVRAEYRSMQHLYNAIKSSPAALKVVQPKDYTSAITGAQENAAEVRYDRGTQLLDNGDKASARQAYDEFAAAEKLVPNFRDVKALKEEAYNMGVVRVVISQLEVRSPYFQFSADQFRDYLVQSVQRQNINRFVQFYDDRFAAANKVPADEYLELRFFDFVVGQTYVDRVQRDVSREIQDGVVKDTTGKETKKFITVKATLFLTKQTVVSKGLLDYRIIATANSQTLRQNRIPGSFTWLNEYGYYKGDKRALSDEDLRQIGGREMAPPPPDQLFLEFTKPIYTDLERELRTFYNNI
ncbi:hypothetical protein SAMN05444266_11566 [Chitinophaga jiangningensis]|uniref:Tetratricopeptide repeat-containing protein n=1 Tax=Chitinophaga jiangningensis TaxID=1419482 RepID=A0A1M7MYB2_9BACT|nr:hypothetical protein [Chitinophaga jiangningensis]SHM96082.1 hypothetical protein SAMN05444266_11566 [Chitinophaga jiangningensis]